MYKTRFDTTYSEGEGEATVDSQNITANTLTTKFTRFLYLRTQIVSLSASALRDHRWHPGSEHVDGPEQGKEAEGLREQRALRSRALGLHRTKDVFSRACSHVAPVFELIYCRTRKVIQDAAALWDH